MIQIVFFLVVISVLFVAVLKRPGVAVAYVLFFQALNSMVFGEVGVSIFRYATTLLVVPAVVLLHQGTNNYGILSTTVLRSRIYQGYLLLAGYMAMFAVYTGTSHEYGFLMSFLIPGTVLFLMAGSSLNTTTFYDGLFTGSSE